MLILQAVGVAEVLVEVLVVEVVARVALMEDFHHLIDKLKNLFFLKLIF